MRILKSVSDAKDYVGRCRVRVFSGASVAANLAARLKAAQANDTGRSCVVMHGGRVANCYAYPATTQALLVAAWADGRRLALTAAIRANKATWAGAAAATVGEAARPVWDQRYGAAAREAARAAMWARLEELATPENLWVDSANGV